MFYGKLPYGCGLNNPEEIFSEIKGNEVVFPSDPKNEDINVF